MLTDGYLLLRGILTKAQQQAISSEIPFPPSGHKALQTYPGDAKAQFASCQLAMDLVQAICDQRSINRIGPTLIPKAPGEGARGWHQDHRFWGDDSAYGELPPAVGVMFYPDGADLKRGLIKLAPRSHRQWTTGHEELLRCDDGSHDGTADGSLFMLSTLAWVMPTIEPCDVLLLDARTLHCSSKNLSDQVRRCLNVWCWFEEPTELVRFPIRERMLKT